MKKRRNSTARQSSGAPEGELRLALKRYGCRLPLRLACRLEALFEMHPDKTRSQLMADLLDLGLAGLERAHAGAQGGDTGSATDTRQAIYLLSGPFAEFHGLLHKHHLALERELANEEAAPSPAADVYTLGDVE